MRFRFSFLCGALGVMLALSAQAAPVNSPFDPALAQLMYQMTEGPFFKGVSLLVLVIGGALAVAQCRITPLLVGGVMLCGGSYLPALLLGLAGPGTSPAAFPATSVVHELSATVLARTPAEPSAPERVGRAVLHQLQGVTVSPGQGVALGSLLVLASAAWLGRKALRSQGKKSRTTISRVKPT